MQPANRVRPSTQPLVAAMVPPPSPPLKIETVTKKRGRPLGWRKKQSIEKLEERNIAKASQTLERVTKDVIALSAPLEDGGATSELGPVIDKDSLSRRISRRLNVLDRYLTDDRLTGLLEISGLKEIGVYEAIMMDKLLLTKGEATVIVGSKDRAAMDEVLPKLLDELKRRKLVTSVSERKIEFTG